MRRRGARGSQRRRPTRRERVMENDGTDSPGVSRREFLERLAAGGAGPAGAGGLARPGAPAWAAKGSGPPADGGGGDPGGDWAQVRGPTGWGGKVGAVGNAPAGVGHVPHAR